MTITIMKTTFQKLKPTITYYRNHKIYPMINLEKNFCSNYQWKTLITQLIVWKNSYRSTSVCWTSSLLRKKNKLEAIICHLLN